MKAIRHIAAAILFCSLLTQCKKAVKGDTGPQGPAGPSGVSMQVATYTTSSGSWTAYNWPYNYLETTLNISSITSGVVNNGDVRVFLQNTSDTSWIALPQPFLSTEYNYHYKTGKVFIDITLTNNGTPTSPGSQVYKVIVLPPAFITKHPDVNVSNYKEVVGALNNQ